MGEIEGFSSASSAVENIFKGEELNEWVFT
jgi:hypothetical protein